MAVPQRHPGGFLRLKIAGRYLLLTGVLVGVVGVAGDWLAWPFLTSTVGPTAYVFTAHPGSEASRFRNVALGRTVAVQTHDRERAHDTTGVLS